MKKTSPFKQNARDIHLLINITGPIWVLLKQFLFSETSQPIQKGKKAPAVRLQTTVAGSRGLCSSYTL